MPIFAVALYRILQTRQVVATEYLDNIPIKIVAAVVKAVDFYGKLGDWSFFENYL